MNEVQQSAARVLIRLSALDVNPHINACVDTDSWRIDWERLDTWRWSSGETVLVGLLRVICGYHSDVKVADLYLLDRDNQQAAIYALSLAFGQHSLEPLS